jgi:hypothetical protein
MSCGGTGGFAVRMVIVGFGLAKGALPSPGHFSFKS